MFLTAAVSSGAVILYIPLAVLVPKPVDTSKDEKKFTLTVEEYEALSDVEFKRLPLAEVHFMEKQRKEQGKHPRTLYWGDYSEELPELDYMMTKALVDLKYLRHTISQKLTNHSLLEDERKNNIKLEKQMTGVMDVERQKREMGEWITAYLHDAGYTDWHRFSLKTHPNSELDRIFV